jgi:CDP-diacylglycerol--glycerol-3-phosphate 3-phosphatidyltransferase
MRITANQVTLLRLLLIPIPGWLLYQGPTGQMWALALATLLGCTDFIDGYLARKYGSTVLGGLLDPIADKVFIAVTFLPAVDQGWVPPWLVAALFMREFLVTALRSSYERRGQALKSTYLARYKTWAQMCGVAIIMLVNTISARANEIVLAVCTFTPLVLFAIRYLLVRKPWKGAAWFAASGAMLLVAIELTGPAATGRLLMYFVLAVTWASGLGYLTGVPRLHAREPVGAGDLVRIATAAALPCLIVAVQVTGRAPVWALIALTSFELAHGGLDNLLAHHRADASATSWGARLGIECLLLVLALRNADATIAVVAAFAVGAVGLGVAFRQKRRYYLDAAPPSPTDGRLAGVSRATVS